MGRKLLVSLLLGSILLLDGCGDTGGSEATYARMRKNRMVPIGTVPFGAPILYQKGGDELVGPDAQLAQLIAERIGGIIQETGALNKPELRWIARSYSTLVNALQNEEVDLVMGVYAITEERKQEIAFSPPYYTSELVLAMNPVYKEVQPNDLAGLKVGVRENTGVSEFVAREYSRAEITPFETLDSAVLTLRRGEIQAIIDDRYMLAFALDTVPGVTHLEIVPGVLGEVECAVALRKRDEGLLEVVNEIVNQVNSENLYAQWLEEIAVEEQYVRVEQRQQARLDAGKPRRLVIQISKDQDNDFDIYRMANLTYTLTDAETGETFTSSRIDFRNRVGFSSATIPPGTYQIKLVRMNNYSPGAVTVTRTDPDQVTLRIRLRAGGNVVMTRS